MLPCKRKQALEVRLQDIEFAVQDHALPGTVAMALRAVDVELARCLGIAGILGRVSHVIIILPGGGKMTRTAIPLGTKHWYSIGVWSIYVVPVSFSTNS
jgi:hypothetical protein